MMKDDDKISDTELHAYVDGQLPDSDSDRVQSWLNTHESDAKRVRSWHQQNEAILKYFDKPEFNDTPARLDPVYLQRQRKRQLRSMAAVWLVFFIGGAIGWFSNEHLTRQQVETHQLAEPAIAAYRVYAVEVRHPVEVGADQEQHLVNWLSKRLGTPLHIPNLESEGFHLIGGRLLSVPDGPAAQFMFENSAGQRITLYTARSLNTHNTAFQFTRSDDINGVFWIDSPLGYGVVGEVPRDLLLRISHLVYKELDKFGPTDNNHAI